MYYAHLHPSVPVNKYQVWTAISLQDSFPLKLQQLINERQSYNIPFFKFNSGMLNDKILCDNSIFFSNFPFAALKKPNPRWGEQNGETLSFYWKTMKRKKNLVLCLFWFFLISSSHFSYRCILVEKRKERILSNGMKLRDETWNNKWKFEYTIDMITIEKCRILFWRRSRSFWAVWEHRNQKHTYIYPSQGHSKTIRWWWES